MRVEVLLKDFPCEEITELLHESYKEHLEAGRRYFAAIQTVEQTRERLEGTYCVVAYDGDRLVGTLSFRIYHKEDVHNRKWYEDDTYLYIGQLAVLPSYRKSKALVLMAMKASTLEEVKECKSAFTDTSTEADALVESYLKLGFQIVDFISWETTNYYSYVFRREITGKKFSDAYCMLRFNISKMLCMIQYTKDGKKRF